jgi:microcompartment protein CcmK/EutM
MRIGKVIGRICLNTTYETLVGARFLLVAVQDRFALAGQPRKTAETLVVYDNLGATEGDTIAFAESREACMPFYPEKIVPLDAYNAAIIDHLEVNNSVLSVESAN